MNKNCSLFLFYESYSRLGSTPYSTKFLSSGNGREKLELPLSNELYLLTCAMLGQVF